MKLEITHEAKVKPSEVAKTLADATPEEFAEVFLNLHRYLDEHPKKNKIDAIGKAMSPDLGANRKHIFRKIEARITYHENIRESKQTK